MKSENIHEHRDLYLQVVEELRLLRASHAESNKKVKTSLDEKLRFQNLVQSLKNKLERSEKQCEELEGRWKTLQHHDTGSSRGAGEDVEKYKIAVSVADKTIESLQQQLIASNSNRELSEMRLAEVEKKLRMKEQSHESFMENSATFQQAVEKLNAKLDKTATLQQALEDRIQEVNETNGRLEHQIKLQIEVKEIEERENDKLKNKVIDLERKLLTQSASDNFNEELSSLRLEVSKLKRDLELETDSKTFLETELNECKTQLQAANIATTKAMELLKMKHTTSDGGSTETIPSYTDDGFTVNVERVPEGGGDAPVVTMNVEPHNVNDGAQETKDAIVKSTEDRNDQNLSVKTIESHS